MVFKFYLPFMSMASAPQTVRAYRTYVLRDLHKIRTLRTTTLKRHSFLVKVTRGILKAQKIAQLALTEMRDRYHPADCLEHGLAPVDFTKNVYYIPIYTAHIPPQEHPEGVFLKRYSSISNRFFWAAEK